LQDTCNALGVCVDNQAAVGASCGDATTNACNGADTCDAAGACLTNLATDGTTCGDTVDDECKNPDSCATGVCVSNDEAVGAPCGDQQTLECTAPDTCDAAGICQQNHAANTVACGNPAVANGCDLADTCVGDGTCGFGNSQASGTACGAGGVCFGEACSVCPAPLTLTAGTVTVPWDNSGASDYATGDCDGEGTPDAVFTFTAPATATFRFAVTTTAAGGPVITLTLGLCDPEQLPAACDPDLDLNGTATVDRELQANESVTITAGEFFDENDGDTGNLTIEQLP
jgi:hypothetical protein